MMKIFTNAAVACIAVACMAVAPAIAQQIVSPLESGGTISGTRDLEPVAWSVARVDGVDSDLTSTWAPTSTGRLVRPVGVARQSGESGLTDALIIMFHASGNPAEPDVEDPMVAHFPAGAERTWIAEDENIDLSVEALEVSGNSMGVAGSFVAQMTPGGRKASSWTLPTSSRSTAIFRPRCASTRKPPFRVSWTIEGHFEHDCGKGKAVGTKGSTEEMWASLRATR